VDVYVRRASFMPHEHNLTRRLYAYADEVRHRYQQRRSHLGGRRRCDTARWIQRTTRVCSSATSFNRFAVTREINDGLLAPRFAPSQRAWLLQGTLVPVNQPHRPPPGVTGMTDEGLAARSSQRRSDCDGRALMSLSAGDPMRVNLFPAAGGLPARDLATHVR
jgi:hypothetical protein